MATIMLRLPRRVFRTFAMVDGRLWAFRMREASHPFATELRWRVIDDPFPDRIIRDSLIGGFCVGMEELHD